MVCSGLGRGSEFVFWSLALTINNYTMKIRDIITENIFTTDYHQVMDAVAKLYNEHYNVNIWDNAQAHDDAAKVLMKQNPSMEELEYIIKTAELPERFQEVDFPINDDIMFGVDRGDSDDLDLDEAPASRALCTSGKSDSALGASQLASCKSQGYRSRDGGKSHKVGGERVKVRGKKIKGKKYGGPLPDWS